MQRAPWVIAGPWQGMGNPQAPTASALTLAQGREPVADLMRNWGNRARQAAGLEPDRRQPDTHVTLAGVASSW